MKQSREMHHEEDSHEDWTETFAIKSLVFLNRLHITLFYARVLTKIIFLFGEK